MKLTKDEKADLEWINNIGIEIEKIEEKLYKIRSVYELELVPRRNKYIERIFRGKQ